MMQLAIAWTGTVFLLSLAVIFAAVTWRLVHIGKGIAPAFVGLSFTFIFLVLAYGAARIGGI